MDLSWFFAGIGCQDIENPCIVSDIRPDSVGRRSVDQVRPSGNTEGRNTFADVPCGLLPEGDAFRNAWWWPGKAANKKKSCKPGVSGSRTEGLKRKLTKRRYLPPERRVHCSPQGLGSYGGYLFWPFRLPEQAGVHTSPELISYSECL